MCKASCANRFCLSWVDAGADYPAGKIFTTKEDAYLLQDIDDAHIQCLMLTPSCRHEGEGSVFAVLKARGWATSLVAGEGALSFSNRSFFMCKADLTDAGGPPAHLFPTAQTPIPAVPSLSTSILSIIHKKHHISHLLETGAVFIPGLEGMAGGALSIENLWVNLQTSPAQCSPSLLLSGAAHICRDALPCVYIDATAVWHGLL